MNDQSLINTLIDLLKIKSLTGFEEDIKNYIFDYIKNIINNDQSICIYQKRNNVVVYHNDLPKENVIAFIGHIDTVDNINEYNAKLIDGKIYGLGSSDMKSGVAIILNLFKIFYNLNNIIWIFYDQEEGPYINNGLNILFKDLKELLSKIDLAIILEPTNNYIELGC
ncbi:MAG: M20/M25/M40 family metallo-hydrolase, partial [bacterium]